MTQQRGAGQPKYMAIAADLRVRIAAGTWPLNSKMPPVHELGDEYEAAPNTIRSAIGVLVQEGLAESFQGDGVYVRRILPAPPQDGMAAIVRRIDDLEVQVMELRAAAGLPVPQPDSRAEASG